MSKSFEGTFKVLGGFRQNLLETVDRENCAADYINAQYFAGQKR